MSLRLQGLTAIVTGSSSGIGRAIALEFAAQGAKLVACIDQSPVSRWGDAGQDGNNEHQATHKAICAQYGPDRAMFLQCDVTVERTEPEAGDGDKILGVADAITLVAEASSRIDVIVNSAGIGNFDVAIHEQDYDDWNKSMAANLNGPFLCMKHALLQFLKQEADEYGFRGNIINIASIGANVGLNICGAYCAAQGAILSLTREAAIEYAPKGIRANTLVPGYIATPMVMPWVERLPQWADYLYRSIAQGRLGEPQDVAPAAVWLASGRESAYVTGIQLPIDGGFTAR